MNDALEPDTKGELSDTSHWDRTYRGQPTERPRPGPIRRAFRRLRRRKFDSVLRQFVDVLPTKTPAILELGCAPGLMLECIAGVAPSARLFGIDYSPVGVSVTRRRLESAGIEATIVQGDFRTAELASDISLVVSFGLIEHFDDPTPILRQHMRFGGAGSWVGVTVPNLAPPVVEKLARHYAPDTMATHNLDIMDCEAIGRALGKAGLVDVRTGASGGPNLSAAVEPGHPTGGLYRRMADLWNLAAEILPFDPFWHRTLWGLGRVPAPQTARMPTEQR